MNNPFKLVFLAIFLLVPAVVFGQGSGSTEPRNKPKKDNFAVTRAATGVMESRDSDSIVIALENGEELKLDISSKTRFVGDPQIGQRVRVTYQTKDRRATVVRKL